MVNTISNIFNQKKSGLVITAIYQLTKTEYVVEAKESTVAENYNDPFYKVDVDTGTVKNYLPIAELDRFIEAVENRTIYKCR